VNGSTREYVLFAVAYVLAHVALLVNLLPLIVSRAV
jgi:hypothetical protein